jgi:hypothetical protein
MSWKDKAKAMVKGGNPAPAVSGPQVWELAHGDEDETSTIVLEVNREHLSTVVANDLVGTGPTTDAFSELVEVLMFRDETSEFEDSVRVELPDGRLVGWITKADSKTACELIEFIAQSRDRRERGLPIRLMVSLCCEGWWPDYEDGDDPTDPDVGGIEFEVFEVQIQDDPMQAEML